MACLCDLLGLRLVIIFLVLSTLRYVSRMIIGFRCIPIRVISKLFFSLFCNPVERDKMQPSLVLSILAVSAFMTSSEIDQGTNGRMRSLWLRDAAQSSLEASLNAQWIDPTLAQAAWVGSTAGPSSPRSSH